MTLSLELASRIRAFDTKRIGAELARAAKTAIVDTVGVTLLGAEDESTRILADTPGVAGAPGSCVVIGTPMRRSPLDAALLNGVASHAHDFDDFSREFGGHPSVPVLPALFAVSERGGVTGADLIAAYVVGVETETRIADGVHFHHYQKGWHPTATLGIFGAVAGCARLMGLDEPRTATALCIAASLSSGIKANFGTMTKPLHVGHCARNGVLAALLAERGFSAKLDAFEAPQGFLNVFNDPERFDTVAMLQDWYEPPVVSEPGISIKQFPCCGSTHPAIYAALELRREHDFDAADIAGVEIRAHPLRLPHTDNAAPGDPLEAKFSIQYCVARALLSGGVSLADFESERIDDPQVRRLMGLIRVIADAETEGGQSDPFGAAVSVAISDGRYLETRVARRAGRGADNPMTHEELRAKFEDCARSVFPSADRAALWELLWRLETLADVRELTEAMASSSAPALASKG
jgi:2-methylcitrate dehydratase PrpD